MTKFDNINIRKLERKRNNAYKKAIKQHEKDKKEIINLINKIN